MIRTERLRLRPFERSDFQAMAEGDAALARTLRVTVADRWVEPEHRLAVASGAEFLQANPAAGIWWTYAFIHETDATLIGAGGFKGPPAGGVVEMGYGLAPSYRSKGLAEEAARGMLRFALGHADVQAVHAHTLPEENASTRLLARLGFEHVRTLTDPDDGTVWLWSTAPSAG